MPMCACGHRLADHCNDYGHYWAKNGFCTMNWRDAQGNWTETEGCQCAEFRLKLRSTG